MSSQPALMRDVSRASSTLLMSDYDEDSEYSYNSDDEGDGSAVVSSVEEVISSSGGNNGGGSRPAEAQFLDQAGLQDFLSARLNDFVEITCSDLGQAQRFLRDGHWQLQDATTAFFSAPESETTMSESAEKKGTCMICAEDDVELSDVGCGHAFCEDCWIAYIRQRVAGEGNALFIPCMGFKCKRVLGIDMVRRIVAKCSDGVDEEDEALNAMAATSSASAADGEGAATVGTAAAAAATSAGNSGIGRVGLRLLRGFKGGVRGKDEDAEAIRNKRSNSSTAVVSSSSASSSSSSTQPDAASLKQLYERLLVNDIVMSYPRLRFCQSPSCGLAALVDDQTRSRVDCTCGASFCFPCGNESHVPCTCETLRLWAAKEVGEGETFNWIAANTKDCPSCQSPIEKNHGCNHMTCSKCNHGFCWLCLGKWANHTSCNAYEATGSETTASEAREAIKRYNHYWTRYNVHRQAQKLEGDLRVRTQRSINDMFADQRRMAGADFTSRKLVLEAQNEAAEKEIADAAQAEADAENGGNIDETAAAAAAEGVEAAAAAAAAAAPPVQVTSDVLASTWNILEEATENLINCRRVLRFTYIHAYFLKVNSNELHLFEFLQAELEAVVEQLSHLLETKSTQKLLSDRQEIKQSSFDASGRLKNLVDGVASGGFTVDVPSETAPAGDVDGADTGTLAAAAAASGSGGGRSMLRSVANALRSGGTSR